MTSPEEIVLEARRWIDTPFHHQGYLKGIGADCIGLVAGVALHFGLPGASEWVARPEYHNYTPQPDPRLLLAGCNEFLDPVEILAIRLADILVMRMEKEPMHFALVSSLAPTYVIHSLISVGRVREHRLSEAWREHVMRAYRFRGIA